MNIISLISDRKPGDFFLGRLKAYIIKNIGGVSFIDLACGLPEFNTKIAAFVIKNGFSDFPDNTFHLAGVDAEVHENKSILAVKAYNQFFICADNGLISLVFEPHEIEKIVKFDVIYDETYKPSLFKFADIVKEIISDISVFYSAENFTGYRKNIDIKPTFGNNFIGGNIIYSDSYENAITNISQKNFEQTASGRKFSIFAGSRKNVIKKIDTKYSDVEPGELVAFFNSYKLLEIAMNKGQLMKMFNFSVSTGIRIEFYD